MSFFKKIGFKKRVGSCPPINQGGSPQLSYSRKNVQSVESKSNACVDNVVKTVEKASKSDAVRTPVVSRTFINSNLSSKNINALMARGNKFKTLENMKQSHITNQSVNIVTQGVHNEGCRVKTKVFRNKTGYNTNQDNDKRCQIGGHWSVATVLEADQCPQPRETVASQSQCTNATQNIPEIKSHMSDDKYVPHESVTLNATQALLFDINGIDEDKFANTMFSKHVNRQLRCQAEINCDNYKNWKCQTAFDFGFTPLGEFVSANSTFQSNYTIDDPIELHKIVKSSGKYNYLGCRIPIKSQLKVDAWVHELEGYWDSQLLEFLTYGFPLDFNRDANLRCEGKNHNSALQFPRDVDAYLQEETKFKAIIGPFDNSPIDKLHYSPFMTREKSNAAHRRVIIDLSWPKDASVNLGIDKDSYLATNFDLTFPTVDHITDAVKNVGPGAHLFKIDISRAFRHVKIDPFDLDLLGLRWRDVTYVNTCLPFGSRHGTQIFQRISDAVRFMMRRAGYDVINYVDDFVGVATPSVAHQSYEHLTKLLERLGLDVSVKKLVSPSTSAICLGVEIDTVAKTIAIPQEKLDRIHRLLDEWRHKRFCSTQQLQSLLGNLLYVHKCVRPARIFVNRMLELLRQNYDKKSITLTTSFRRDLRWFDKFLEKYNGTSFFDHKPIFGTIELDACLTGFGGCWENLVYHVPIQRRYLNLAITQLEMLNILVAIRIFSKYWQGQKIKVKCDNMAVVQVLQTGKVKDPFLGACARNIWMETAKADIEVRYSHIEGRNNVVADLLSRWKNSDFQNHILNQNVRNPTWMIIPHDILEIDNEI